MNIFAIDKDPWQAAMWLCDQHKGKMILESTQLICNAYHFTGQANLVKEIYRPAYAKHPSTTWVCLNAFNFAWLVRHLGALLDIYDTHGSDGSKTKYMRVRTILNSMMESDPPDLPVLKRKPMPPFLAFGSEDKEVNKKCKAIQAQFGTWNETLKVWESKTWENGVAAYRTYYNLKQFKNSKRPTWKNESMHPDWYVPIDICNLEETNNA